jgi:hypothetical protein
MEVIEMDDPERRKCLARLDTTQLMDVAAVCNRYPTVEVDVQVGSEEVAVGDTAEVVVSLERDMAEAELSAVVTPFFPKPKEECWYVVVGDEENDELLFTKRVNFAKSLKVIGRAEGGRADFGSSTRIST